MAQSFAVLEKRVGYTFKSKRLLDEALTHSSAKDDSHPSNERLEFLGDSVLGLVITEHIFNTLPDLDEGELTAIKSIVVSKASLMQVGKKLKLKPFLKVGRGIAKNRALPDSLVANTVEALIGAIYKDSGIREGRKFVMANFSAMTDKALRNRRSMNYKSRLQYYVQKKFGLTPHYRVLSMEGPEHSKTFTLSAIVGSREFPPGTGKTKKDAGQKAARQALRVLQEEYGRLRHSGS
jgi:ribonuclease-3